MTSSPPTSPTPGRLPGPRVRTAVIVGVVGIVVGIVAAAVLASAVFNVFASPRYRIPGTVVAHLGSGRYVIYEHSRRADLYDTNGAPRSVVVTISPATVRITGPDGSRVPIDPSPSHSTIFRGSDRFVSALGFHAPSDGTYTLFFDQGESSEVMVQRTFGDQIHHNLGWILAVPAGGLLLVIGCVMFVVGLVRRSAADRAALATTGPAAPSGPIAPASPLPAASWHPDPTGEHRLRYWDGTRWTEHTSD